MSTSMPSHPRGHRSILERADWQSELDNDKREDRYLDPADDAAPAWFLNTIVTLLILWAIFWLWEVLVR